MYLFQKPSFSFRNFVLIPKPVLDISYGYYYGRDALYAGINVLELIEGDTVLVPASICAVVLVPLVQKKILIEYYDIDESFNLDLDKVENKLGNPHVKGLLYVNYFGLSQSAVKVKKICEKYNVLMIEDCALTFPTKNSSVGTIGDVAIFSLRKVLPVSDGGILVINNKELKLNEQLIPKIKIYFEIKSLILFVGKIFYQHLSSFSFFRKRFDKRYSKSCDAVDNLEPIDLSYRCYNTKMTFVSTFIFNHTNTEKLIETSNYNFQKIVKLLKSNTKIRIPHEASVEGALPYLLPVYIENRDKVLGSFWANGIFLEPALNDMTIISGRTVCDDIDQKRLGMSASHFLGLVTHSVPENYLEMVRGLDDCL